MKPENSIEVKNITKCFKVYLDKGRTLKELALFSRRRKYEERRVLDGISFEVKRGEAIGLVGHNGCGKSTTLKLLTRIMYPDSGTIEMRGRVSSLIELGAGFHPDLSGRQNIYTNASIFGLTRKEIDKRLDTIINFSEMRDFIDNPVRTYSSGMYMRLAFAVAINVDADILLIDEILAVGDANFQAKCFDKLKEIKREGTTIVIVSHSLGQIEQICERSIWINAGKIAAEGPPREVHPVYLEYMGQKRQEIASKVALAEGTLEAEVPKEPDVLSIKEAVMLDNEGNAKTIFPTEASAVIRLSYHTDEKLDDVIVGMELFNDMGVKCYGIDTRDDYQGMLTLQGDGKVQLHLDQIMLLPGKYFVDITFSRSNRTVIYHAGKALTFEMYTDKKDSGIVRLDHTWEIS